MLPSINGLSFDVIVRCLAEKVVRDHEIPQEQQGGAVDRLAFNFEVTFFNYATAGVITAVALTAISGFTPFWLAVGCLSWGARSLIRRDLYEMVRGEIDGLDFLLNRLDRLGPNDPHYIARVNDCFDGLPNDWRPDFALFGVTLWKCRVPNPEGVGLRRHFMGGIVAAPTWFSRVTAAYDTMKRAASAPRPEPQVSSPFHQSRHESSDEEEEWVKGDQS